MNPYSFMAHYVAKVLKIRPNDILYHWGVSELIVAYGIYANEQQQKNFNEIKEHNKVSNKKIPQIEEYAVRFRTREDLLQEQEERESDD